MVRLRAYQCWNVQIVSGSNLRSHRYRQTFYLSVSPLGLFHLSDAAWVLPNNNASVITPFAAEAFLKQHEHRKTEKKDAQVMHATIDEVVMVPMCDIWWRVAHRAHVLRNSNGGRFFTLECSRSFLANAIGLASRKNEIPKSEELAFWAADLGKVTSERDRRARRGKTAAGNSFSGPVFSQILRQITIWLGRILIMWTDTNQRFAISSFFICAANPCPFSHPVASAWVFGYLSCLVST